MLCFRARGSVPFWQQEPRLNVKVLADSECLQHIKKTRFKFDDYARYDRSRRTAPDFDEFDFVYGGVGRIQGAYPNQVCSLDPNAKQLMVKSQPGLDVVRQGLCGVLTLRVAGDLEKTAAVIARYANAIRLNIGYSRRWWQ